MAEIELNRLDFITVGTVGPKGKRQFYLQAGGESQIVSLFIEKDQARALGEALRDMLDDLMKNNPNLGSDMPEMSRMNMELREPFEGRFRVSRIGLGYDDTRDQVVLVAEELVILPGEGEDGEPILGSGSVARFWGSRQQMRALSLQCLDVVKQGRANPAHNGRVLYYWT
jgi:uncharacterized repeat protein (TIGR03847 family)